MVSPNRSRSPKSQMEMMMSHDGCVAGARLGYGRLLWLISAIALAWTGSLSAQDFWVDQPYAQWTQDECQQLISRATVRPFPWKKDLGRSGFVSKGVLVWYSETVWKAFFKTRNFSDDEVKKRAAECKPALLMALYFKDDPGYDTISYRANYSPQELLASTRLDNGRGAVIPPSPQMPDCKPFIDKYTIVFYFPITPALSVFLERADLITFECAGLGISQTFNLDEMQINGLRDTHWRVGPQLPAQPSGKRVVQPLPFKVFPEPGTGQ